MDKKKVKLGIAPIAWTNDDMPDLGGGNTFEQCVSEMALAGFKGTELGNKYPADPRVLKKALKLRGLRLANSWFSSFLLTEPYEKVEKDFVKKCRFLRAAGARAVGASEQSYSVQGQPLPVFGAKHIMDDAEWDRLCDGLNRLGAKANDLGMTLVYHHHMGTVVQTAEETDRLLEGTSADALGLLFDSGHFAYSGDGPAAVLAKHAGRTRHVHLKDIRGEEVVRVKAEGLSFLEGVRLGTFTVPGDGDLDFAPLFELLAESGYEGWMIVEAEQDPAIADPLEYAIKARKYIKKTAGI